MQLARGRLGADASDSVLSRASPWPGPESAFHVVCPTQGALLLGTCQVPPFVKCAPTEVSLEEKPSRRRLNGPSNCRVMRSEKRQPWGGQLRAPPPLAALGPVASSVDGTCAVPNQAKGRAVSCSPVSPAGSALGLVHGGLSKHLLNNGPLGSDVLEDPMVLEYSIVLEPVLLRQEHRGSFS